MGRLLTERILSSGLQVTYADAKMAHMDKADQATQAFYSRRQQLANRQHLAAIRAWVTWQQMSGESSNRPTAAAEATHDASLDGDVARN